MNGTKLAPMDTGVKWKIGGVAEVTWQIENHHGGGYQYRLCPADEPLTDVVVCPRLKKVPVDDESSPDDLSLLAVEEELA